MNNPSNIFFGLLQIFTFLMVLAMFFNYLNRQSYSSPTTKEKKPERWFLKGGKVYLRLEDGREVLLNDTTGQNVLCRTFDPEDDEYCYIECRVEEVSGHFVKLQKDDKSSFNGWHHVDEAFIMQVKTVEANQPRASSIRAHEHGGILG